MKEISHQATVIRATDREVEVEILACSACGNCKIRSACSMSETEEKKYTLPRPDGFSAVPGDTVNLVIGTKTGLLSVLLAYVIPVLVLVGSLALLVGLAGEAAAALITLGLIMLYFIILYSLRDRLKKTIAIRIEKNTDNE